MYDLWILPSKQNTHTNKKTPLRKYSVYKFKKQTTTKLLGANGGYLRPSVGPHSSDRTTLQLHTQMCHEIGLKKGIQLDMLCLNQSTLQIPAYCYQRCYELTQMDGWLSLSSCSSQGLERMLSRSEFSSGPCSLCLRGPSPSLCLNWAVPRHHLLWQLEKVGC